MSADEAFANLMRDKKLAIPAARSAPALSSERSDEVLAATSRPVAPSDFIEPDADSDYHPYGTPGAMEAVVAGHPTETDLKAVGAGETQIFDDAAESRRERDSTRTIDAGEAGESETNLGRARRVKRFNYLPLGGASDFEIQTMDLSARLASMSPDQPSLLVTSAQRGEGRTELAIRLSLALARRVGTRALLVDFDLRRPQAAMRLGVSVKYFTLTDVLRGACPLEEALTVSDEDGLYVLPSRASDRIGDEIIDARNLGALMDTVHRAFDFTIFDCPPAEHTDTINLCRHAGAAMLCGYSGITSARRLNAAADRLSSTGIRVAGMMLLGE